MNVADIKSRFWTLLGGSPVPHPNITDDVLLAWANMATRELAEETNCINFRYSIALTAGTQEYSLPSTCKTVYRAYYDGEKLLPTSKWDLMHGDDSWDSRTGTPSRYYLDGLNGKVGLWPTPAADTVLDGPSFESLDLELYLNGNASTLADDDDIPSIPAWAHPGVLYYMMRQAYVMIGPQRNVRAAAFWGELYRRTKLRLKGRSTKREVMPLTIHSRGERPGRLMPPRYPEHIPDPEA